jgi:putative transposase
VNPIRSPHVRRSFTKEFQQESVQWVIAQTHTIRTAAEAIGVSQQTMRNWYAKHAPEPEPANPNATIEQSNDELETACRNTVARAMQAMGLTSRLARRFTPMTTRTDSTRPVACNTLNRDFSAASTNRKWVTDITYLPTATGWVYLAVVLDLFSRKVVGWSLQLSLATDVVVDALTAAIATRQPNGRQLLLHSDRGCQYTSDLYQQILHTLGITCSMSRPGNCYDNAVMERFFWSLKHEWTNHETDLDVLAARQGVALYIDTLYPRQRLHQSLGYQSPDQYEAEHRVSREPAPP